MVGSAGAMAGISGNPTLGVCDLSPREYIAKSHSNYGFGRMEVYNQTHLKFEFIRMTNGQIEDEMWIIKE
jgi:hypothetical protein